MPTPSSNSPQFAPQLTPVDAISSRTTCPPEGEADRDIWIGHPDTHAGQDSDEETTPTLTSFTQSQLDQFREHGARLAASSTSLSEQPAAAKAFAAVADNDTTASMSPAISVSSDSKDELGVSSPPATTPTSTGPVSSSTSSMNHEFSNIRLLPDHTSSYLRPGSKFIGTQQSERQVYNVDVEIKHVDIAESYLCGYLRIQGLTEDHPTLTTFFEGEIIGTKHTFQTRHESWGATDKTDMHHWARFPAWRPLAKLAKKPDFTYKNFAQRENIFMRWKEYFLVPDHRVRSISGASFEGFYYICFNQFKGTISGMYFHAKSEKFQQLELKHVENRGSFGALEFR